MKKMKKNLFVGFLILVSLSTTACSIDASLGNLTGVPSVPVEVLSRKSPDFISGEVVTSQSGYQVRGVIGEITEKRTLSNGYKIDGTFYE